MTQRIATVTATGDKFLVQQLNIGNDRAYCWGQCVAFHSAPVRRGEDPQKALASTTHEAGGKTFLLSAVTIVEVEVTVALATELMRQWAKAKGVPMPAMRTRRSRR